jgi:hypothetical protein
MIRALVISTLAVLALATWGCLPPQTGYDAQRDNPIGPSFWVIPTPGDDASLLGRVFVRPPDSALTLEEQSSPNPCAGALDAPRSSPMTNRFENAIATQDAVTARGLLSTYGFSAAAGLATHLLYKITTSSKRTQLDTTAYQACCREHDCGWGYVQALVQGEGEYAAGSEATAALQGNYVVLTGGAARSFRVTQRREVRGYLAALVAAHDRREAVQPCAPGHEWAAIECVPKGQTAQMEDVCRHGTPESRNPFWKDSEGMQKMFRDDQRAACDWLVEHGHVRRAPSP